MSERKECVYCNDKFTEFEDVIRDEAGKKLCHNDCYWENKFKEKQAELDHLEALVQSTEKERLTILGCFEKSNENCKRLEEESKKDYEDMRKFQAKFIKADQELKARDEEITELKKLIVSAEAYEIREKDKLKAEIARLKKELAEAYPHAKCMDLEEEIARLKELLSTDTPVWKSAAFQKVKELEAEIAHLTKCWSNACRRNDDLIDAIADIRNMTILWPREEATERLRRVHTAAQGALNFAGVNLPKDK